MARLVETQSTEAQPPAGAASIVGSAVGLGFDGLAGVGVVDGLGAGIDGEVVRLGLALGSWDDPLGATDHADPADPAAATDPDGPADPDGPGEAVGVQAVRSRVTAKGMAIARSRAVERIGGLDISVVSSGPAKVGNVAFVVR